MPAVGEEETRSEVSNSDGVATEQAERAHQEERNVPLVEGAHSDEQKSSRSDSDEGSGKAEGGNKRLPPLLGDFDVLRFKNRFLEVVEELRMRRVIDAENEEHIKSLVTEKHDLQQKLEEAHSNCEAVIEGHTRDEQELRKSYKERLKQAEDEVTRNKLVAESKELELKVVKDEIRSLHLSRYNLEKKVQEQERQLHLQSSSRENYLTQVNQLEQNCLSVSQQASEVNEHMERLQANVKQAVELHKKLEYVNEHQKCELKQCQRQLEQCRRELLEARVKVNSDRETLQIGGGNKCNSHELRMQIELNRQLQDQLSALREEHQSMIQQLKEAHSVVSRHIESSAKLSANEMVMEEELRELKELNEDLQQKLTTAEQMYERSMEKHCKEIAVSNEKCSDLDQRLKALQSDYAALQASHDKLEGEKLAGGREMQEAKEELQMFKDKLKKAEEEIKSLHKDKESVSEELQQLKLSLEDQLANQERLAEKLESENHCTELQPKVSVSPSSPSTTLKVDDSGEAFKEAAAIKTAESVIANPPSLSPVFSPEVILISLPSPVAESMSKDPQSPRKEDTEEVNNRSVPTCEECEDLVVEPMQESAQYNDCPLAAPNVDSSKHKRMASCDENEELLSPGKRPRLDATIDSSGGQSEIVTKVADSPVIVKVESMADKEAHMDNRAESIEQVKLENVKLEQKCTEKAKGEEDQTMLMQTSKEKGKCDSQENAGENVGDQAELLDNEQDDSNVQIVFSDEEDEGGAIGSHVIGGRMISSQMNRQIDRVQVFLKLERLKRPKK